jgi:hypothetical protein
MTEHWLKFVSVLIWQAIVVAGVVMFRKQLAALIERLGRVKVGDAEFEFQTPTSEAVAMQKKIEIADDLFGPGGFYSANGINYLVLNSGLIASDERVVANLCIFSTPRQHTWIVTTNRQVFCLLDDDGTRSKDRVIQWRMALDAMQPVRARPYRRDVGLLDIGERKNWLYSIALHPDPRQLERDVVGVRAMSARS